MTRQMRALVSTGYGVPLDVLDVREVDVPEPGPGQVLVRIEAAALNPFDLALISGAMREAMPVTHPMVLGYDGAGSVAALGRGVDRYAVGDPVLGFFGHTPGTAAEFAVIDAGPNLAPRPPGLDAVRAASIPESGLTALSLLRAAPVAVGQTVLVIGATGGIGMFVVQLGTEAGATVLATAPPSDNEYVRGLGASFVIDYTGTDVVDATRDRYPDGVDLVVDLVNRGEGLRDTARAVRRGGVVVSPLSGPTDLGNDVTGAYIGMMTAEPGGLERLADLAARKQFVVEVGARYELAQGAAAYDDFMRRHIPGKIVITV